MENIHKTITMHANREDDEPMVDVEGLITEEEKMVAARIAAGEDIEMGPIGKGKEKMQAYEEAQGDEMGQQEQEMHEDAAEGKSISPHLYNSSSQSAPGSSSSSELDHESDDPNWQDVPSGSKSKRKIGATMEGPAKKPKANPRKPKRKLPKKRGSAKTRELERRLRSLEESLKRAGGSKQDAGAPTEAGWSAKKWGYKGIDLSYCLVDIHTEDLPLEYEAPLSGLKMCKTCFDEEDQQSDLLLNECWKHPWWDMIEKGNVSYQHRQYLATSLLTPRASARRAAT